MMGLQTVTGGIPVEEITLADGHGHVWIDPPPDVSPQARLELCDSSKIEAELREFRAAGGTLIVDCQPGGCGRDAAMLVRLARSTGVRITATTGFHQRKYYPPEHWLWSASRETAAAYFIEELTSGMREAPGARATTLKIGYEGRIAGQTRLLMEAAAEAARQTGAILLFHTEQGRNVEALLPFFARRGISPRSLYLCHMDKRADLELHLELAQAGVLLGYDTFVRPKYHPYTRAWRLLEALVANGLEAHIAVGLDLAEAKLWRYGGGPGLLTLPEKIVPRLRARGLNDETIGRLIGKNVARRLAQEDEDD